MSTLFTIFLNAASANIYLICKYATLIFNLLIHSELKTVLIINRFFSDVLMTLLELSDTQNIRLLKTKGKG